MIDRDSIPQPTVHRVMTGELKHHHFLKGGQIAHQKSPLTAGSNKRRIGYQLLVNESQSSVFLDLFVMEEGGYACFYLTSTFLAAAWMSPITDFAPAARPALTNGIPDVLVVSKKDVDEKAERHLAQAALDLGFIVEHPASGFAGGVHYVRAMGDAINNVMYGLNAKGIDWSTHEGLGRLSWYVAATMSSHLRVNAPMREMKQGFFLRKPVYSHRAAPQAWLEQVAQSHRGTVQDIKDMAIEYFQNAEPSGMAA